MRMCCLSGFIAFSLRQSSTTSGGTRSSLRSAGAPCDVMPRKDKRGKMICPNCNAEFDAIKARTYPGLGRDFLDKFTGKRGYEPAEYEIDRSALVECPQCHHQFPSEDVKFFGILSPTAIKTAMAICISMFILVVLFTLIKGK